MNPSINLPAEVLASLAPALESVRRDVREGVRMVLVPRIVRAAQVAVRVNGASYAPGAMTIVGAVTDPSALRLPQLLSARDADVEETARDRGVGGSTVPSSWLGLPDEEEDEEDEDEDECDYSGTECCGYCRDCDTHHEEDSDFLNRTCRNCGVCPECDHVCAEF